VLKIVEESLDRDVLKVKLRVELRTIASRPLVMIKTIQVTDFLKEKYNIIECIKEDIISNSKNGNHKQSGTWTFKVAPAEKKTSSPKCTTKKPSTKSSIRGRMSKIAKEKMNNKQ